MRTTESDRRATSLDRRQFMIGAASVACAAAGYAAAPAPAPASRTTMSIVSYAAGIRQRRNPGLADPLAFLDDCLQFGAGGMQVSLGVRQADYLSRLRQKAESNQFRIEGILDALPRNEAGLARFEQEVITAKGAGATVARCVVTPGRRYEYFNAAAEWPAAAKTALETLQRAEPIVRKHGFRLAVENHKGHRSGENVELMKKLGSEYIGVCVDFGNNFALCEDFMDVVRTLAPYAMLGHIKDHQVREYEDGFLLGDAALGAGFMDLPGMVKVLRDANPKINFGLEVITRDPLRVPVFTPKYWATMADVPAVELARTMRTVKLNASRDPLPTVSGLPIDRQVEAEARNISISVAYAKERLRLM